MKSRLWGILCCGMVLCLSGGQVWAQANEPPVIDAGPDITTQPGIDVILSDSSAVDPNSDSLIIFWSQIDGNVALSFDNDSILHPTIFVPTLVPPAAFAILELLVYDGEFIVTDTMQINIVDPSAAVPVPAAIWLFGSGVVGLLGVARRRNTRA